MVVVVVFLLSVHVPFLSLSLSLAPTARDDRLGHDSRSKSAAHCFAA